MQRVAVEGNQQFPTCIVQRARLVFTSTSRRRGGGGGGGGRRGNGGGSRAAENEKRHDRERDRVGCYGPVGRTSPAISSTAARFFSSSSPSPVFSLFHSDLFGRFSLSPSFSISSLNRPQRSARNGRSRLANSHQPVSPAKTINIIARETGRGHQGNI